MSSAAVSGPIGEEGGRNNKYTTMKAIQSTRHSNAILMVFYCNAIHCRRIGNPTGNLPAPGNYRTDEPEGEGSVFGVLEGGGGHTGSVSGFVVFFWSTLMFKIFPSGLRITLYDFLKF